MKSIVSEKGQVVIPKALRDKMGLAPGTVLDFTVSHGKLTAIKDIAEDPFEKWRRASKLPTGRGADHYLKIIRDDHRG